MFRTDPTLMGAKEPTFQKRSYQMSKFQFSFLHRDVSIAGRFQSAVAKPIVGSNGTSSHDSFLHEGCETVSRCILKNTKANSPKAFILLVFYSNSYKYFACTPTFSFAGFSPPIKVSSTSTIPDKQSRPGRTMARRNLCNHVQAVR